MRALTRTLMLATFAFATAAAACAQTFYEQAYTPWLCSHESRVKSCSSPVPYDLAAYDDFKVGTPGTTVTFDTIVWWGTLNTSAQFGRPYYVAVYKDGGACLPVLTSLVYRNCIKPKQEFVGVDCCGQRVFRFKQVLNPPLTVSGGGHYWLQISESDADSANPDVEDFRWSAHRPIEFCPAAQSDAFGNWYQPLYDLCDGDKDDLAFGLYG